MKKILALVLALAMCIMACTAVADGLKVGVITVGDEAEGYTLAHMKGIEAAAASLGLEMGTDVIYYKKIDESAACTTSAEELFDQGCNLIISNSYGHQDYMDAAINDLGSDADNCIFVSMTGDYAAISGKANFKNAFTKVFQSRYVSGVVAGMKLAELVSTSKLTAEVQPNSFTEDGKIKIGYVGAFPYAEVVSGYTAFFLGVQSVYPDVVMYVQYTNSWFDEVAEGAVAENLVSRGCVIIGQHADSTGAPAAIGKLNAAGTICYSVGYNIDMLEAVPQAADAILTSATNNWAVYYTYLFNAVANGEEVVADWAEGYETGAVAITALGPSCAEGTAEKVAEVEAALASGELQVFDCSKFTVSNPGDGVTVDADGHVTSALVDLSGFSPYHGETVDIVKNGVIEESTFRSAPYFSIRIDGITELSE